MRPLVICLHENESIVKEELAAHADILVLEGDDIDPITGNRNSKTEKSKPRSFGRGPTLNYAFQKLDSLMY